MANIVGGVTSINNPRTNWAQTDKTKADYLKNKPSVAPAIKGTASGEVVGLTDVSPIEHEMGVKVKSANILPYPYLVFANGDVQSKAGITITNQGDRGVYIKGTSTAQEGFKLADIDLGSTWTDASSGVESATTQDGKYTISKYLYYDQTKKAVYIGVKAGVTVDEIIYPQVLEGSVLKPYLEDISTVKVKRYGKNLWDEVWRTGVVLANGTFQYNQTNNIMSVNAIPVKANVRLRVVCPQMIRAVLYDANDVRYATVYPDTGGAITPTQDGYLRIALGASVGTDSPAVTEYGNNICIFVDDGTTDVAYAPYIEPIEYPVSADGTVEGVTSLYPVTTLMTDTAGAIIDAEYNKDTNKVIESLVNAIISLGGNV